MNIVLEGIATTEETLTYKHLPFDVPPGIGRIDVAYKYDSAISSDPTATSGNTVDIGIFDSRGIEFMTSGFRGWSGSARSEFYIAHDEATPGYMPGPIQPGTWHICLGLYKVAPEGCHYRVSIDLTPQETEREVSFPTLLSMRDRPNQRREPSFVLQSNWYRGDIHCHSYHSDGDSDPLDIVRQAEALRLDFLAITDHNVVTQQARLNEIDTDLILIPGYEVTTYFGHWNIWGDGEWVDFRITSADQMQGAIDSARQRGFLVSCNHPKPYGPPWSFEDATGYACVEVWNGPWSFFNPDALDFWETRLKRGERLTAVGGSDSHFLKRDHPAKLGQPTLWVYCPDDPTPRNLLNAIRAGKTFVSARPVAPMIFMSSEQSDPAIVDLNPRLVNAIGMTLEVITAQGCVREYAVEQGDESKTFTIDGRDTPYIRVQLVQDGEVKALTSPIYVSH